MSIFVMRWWSH